MADQGRVESPDEDLPPDIEDWSKHHVRKWVLQLDGVDDGVADILFREDVNGKSLSLFDANDLKCIGVTFGPSKLLMHARDTFSINKPTSSTDQPDRPCKPYPFGRYDDSYRYMEGSFLDITESGPVDLIEPCHEYKAFNRTIDEQTMCRLTEKAICFAAACMNSRTNGTIHFGIGDEPDFSHGEVLGVPVENREEYTKKLVAAIDNHFEYKHRQAAHSCIRPPRFVAVLGRNETSSDKCVIEVDVVPDSTVCGENIFHTFDVDSKTAKKGKTKEFFIRDGGSSRDLLKTTTSAKPMVEYNQFVDGMIHRCQLRKEAEEKHLRGIKNSTQGSRLSQMITGGSASLDKSHFEWYVIVTNKSHSVHFDSLDFLVELNPITVLDFDPESADAGLQCHFQQQSPVNVHLPAQYKITDGVEDIKKRLNLGQTTSWVFCNGGVQKEAPSNVDKWLMDKGASVRDVISFLCRKDILPNKRFLVIFLLWSPVSEKRDPLVETFSAFYQELKGTEQILCLCCNENAFTSWRDLVDARCGIDITPRCIYELSFAEVNGTVLSLLSKNRRCNRFLPCGGGSKVLLEKKVERSLNTLDILCENQCEGGNEDKLVIEKNFYEGGKVSWWNFHFSEQPGNLPFIKRDKFTYIKDTVIPDLKSLRKACVRFNLMHLPGCGGTTLAMHVLWEHRESFRCAVLKNHTDFAEVADQVVQLLTYDNGEQLPRVPVLLMVDDFDDKEKVFELQQLIERECVKKDIQSKSAQVILLNCMMFDESSEKTEATEMVFIGNELSEKEQKLFEVKLKEMEKTHGNTETFYGFMIMKENFKPEYVQGVARNTLKSFDITQKHAKLLAVLALMNVYRKGGSLSVSLCEEFLGLQPKPLCGTVRVEDGFGKFSTLLSTCSVKDRVVFRAVKMIHPSIARSCLEELTTTHNVNKAEIINILLTTDMFYESTQGKDRLLQDVRYILVKRNYSADESRFSPIIQDIINESSGLEGLVLNNAAKRFEKDAVVCQLLARYYYLNKKEFSEAGVWASKARELSRESSYFADTLAQVTKHELLDAISSCKDNTIRPEKLEKLLKMAKKAINVFKETQDLAKKESSHQSCSFNTACFLGELHVGVLVIEVLAKIPVFSSDSVRHDIMSGFLSEEVELKAVESNDQLRHKHKHYYQILGQFEDMLKKLRYRMKHIFDFLDMFYVNLGTKSGMIDTREQRAQKKISSCFSQYAGLFCVTASAPLLKKKANESMKLHEARQYLEKQKANTYSGILSFLSKDNEPDTMNKIAKQSDLVCMQTPFLQERINFMFINVVLSCMKQKSSHIYPHHKVVQLLCNVLRQQIQINESLPLHFIAVVLLWPQKFCVAEQESRNVGQYISRMSEMYYLLMKEVYHNRRPVVHFLLGKRQGYEQLIPLKEIRRCISAGPEEFASKWENGSVWQEPKVKALLFRGSGEVMTGCIQADTCIPNLKLEIKPFFASELSGRAEGSRVSFFTGFTIRGPVALDIL